MLIIFLVLVFVFVLFLIVVAVLKKPAPAVQSSAEQPSFQLLEPIPSLGSILAFVNHTTSIYLTFSDTTLGRCLPFDELLYAVAIMKSEVYLETKSVSAKTIYQALHIGSTQTFCTKDYSRSWSWPQDSETSEVANMIVMLMATLCATDLNVLPYAILDTILEQQHIIYYAIQAMLEEGFMIYPDTYDLVSKSINSSIFKNAMEQYEILQSEKE